MKFTIELDKEQFQRLVDTTMEIYEDLDNKITNLKGRIRRLESKIDSHIVLERTRT